ncbi:hypothetical protein JCM11641_006296 [Rhodosporidiobolus odoratus]
MPILRRRPVPILPLPDLQGIPDDQPVYYLKATGEIFLDYESYATRLSFLLQRQFQCEYSGKTNLDYFSALQSERAESRIVRERFPDELKGRVLATVQFRVMGRLDTLVDHVYERYKDRFFAAEKVFVDLQGDKYFARIASVFPPQNIRDMLPASASSSTDTEAPDYVPVAHKLGIDLNIDAKQAKSQDDASEYLYTVQLMDEEHKFEGSFMEVRARSLSRDRLSFSKSIMKRYLRECLTRSASIGAPWIVKPSIARAFDIPTEQTDNEEERNRIAKEGKLAKRRKTGEGTPVGAVEGRAEGGGKRRRMDAPGTPSSVADTSASTSALASASAAKKPIKYPIEDLDLDATSVIDGRILRRTKTDVPELPVKPQPKKGLLVPKESVDRFVETWNTLNVFSKPLFLSPFSLDDYYGALTHTTLDPRCTLLVEIHASLTNVIGTDTSRVLGSTGAVKASQVSHATHTPTPGPEETGTPMGEDSNPLDAAQDEVPGGGGGEIDSLAAYEQSETNKLVRLGISYGKRWDRQAKLKSAEGREGWERHLIGALCQRGGPMYLEGFVRVMRHLFVGHPGLPERDDEAPADGEEKPQVGAGDANGVKGKEKGKTKVKAEDDDEQEEEEEEEDTSNPELAYLSLSLADKLEVIAYLCTLVMGSKAVRTYIEECDVKLTELRKERAEVNKERKTLVEQQATLAAGGTIPISPTASRNGDAMEVDSRAPSEAGDASSSAARPSSRAPATANGEEDDEEDQLDSDAESTGGASEAGSTLSSSVSRRAAALEEKRLASLAGSSGRGQNIEQLRASAVAKTKGLVARATIDDKIRVNSIRDDTVEREFRRYQLVPRCRPLGKDRFHCRYWWFDGIGGMDLIKKSTVDPSGEVVTYGTGRLIVQGPSREDWEMISESRSKGVDGELSMTKRRVEEEVAEDEEALLGPDEWAYYEDEDDLDTLSTWLNSKGTRELALKIAIAKWKNLLVAGFQKRLHDAAHPELPRYEPTPLASRRSRSVKAEPVMPNTYLGYINRNSKY